jgi:rhodanese-related sulfurtransferase
MPEITPDVARMSADELKRRLDRGDPLAVLDVREDEERAFCAIQVPTTAVDLHIPMAHAPARFEDLRIAAQAAPLVVYCYHGVCSMAVAAWLARRGVRGVHNLDGGFVAWSDSVDPTLPRY